MSKRLFYTKFGWDNIDQKAIERSLKLFALINNELVIPSKHIYSEYAERVFRQHPELLELRIIKPAMDPQYPTFVDYFSQRDRERKAGRKLQNYGNFLDSLEVEKIPYSDTEPAGIFTELAIEQFTDPDSVLSKATKFNSKKAASFVKELEEIKLRSNGVVYFEDFIITSQRYFSKSEQLVIRKFADLNRLIAGAGSKKCNNLLPQENLIDWCLANPDNPNSFILDDEKIFWEVFFESMVKLTEGIFSLNELEKLSPKILDKFSYVEINEFRTNGILQDKFIGKYESILDEINTISRIGEGKLELLNYEELIQTKEKISKEFEESLDVEKSLYVELELIESLLKVAYQIFGSTIQTIEAVVNFFSIPLNKRKNWNNFLQKQENRIKKATKFARNTVSGHPVLIEYMDELLKKSKEAWDK